MRIKINVGPRERLIRYGVGISALLAALSPRVGGWRWLLGAIGVANVVTAATRYCPTNTLLGVDNTRGHELLHFTKARSFGPRLNRLQRRLGATV